MSKMAHQYPQREGEPVCRDFLRTGRCKYGESCKYHHPIGGAKTSNDPREPPFPIRPNEPPCQYFLKHGTCKFGQTCKFHHPAQFVISNGSLNGVPNSVYMMGNGNLVAQTVSHNNGSNETTYGNGGINNSPTCTFVQVLPQRPSESDCMFFMRNGRCKYGSSCKYHHPNSPSMNQDTFPEGGRQRSASVDIIETSSLSLGGVPLYTRKEQEKRRESGEISHDPQEVLTKMNQQSSSSNQQVGNTHLNPSFRQENRNVQSGAFRKRDHSPLNTSSTGTSTTVASSYDTISSGSEFLSNPRHQADSLRSDADTTSWQQGRYHSQDLSGTNNYCIPIQVTASNPPPPPPPRMQSHFSSQRQSNKSQLPPRNASFQISSRNMSDHERLPPNFHPSDSQGLTYDSEYGLSNGGSRGHPSSNGRSEIDQRWEADVQSSALYQPRHDTWKQSDNQHDQFNEHRMNSEGLTRTDSRSLSQGYKLNRRAPMTTPSSHLRRRDFPQVQGHIDEGLSKMTSALLTMLDSPEEERSDSFFQQTLPEGVDSRRLYENSLPISARMNPLSDLDLGMVNSPPMLPKDNIRHFEQVSTRDASFWNGSSSSIPNLERNAQGISFQAPTTSLHSQIFLS